MGTKQNSTQRDGDVTARVRTVVVDCLRRRAAGEAISDESLVQAHPELMPQLSEELRKLRLIGAARDEAEELAHLESGRTIEYTPSRKDSRGLRIRCPHCSNPVEVLSDTPFDEISCGTCGSTFSLVNREDSTRMAAPLKSIDRFDLLMRLGLGGFGTVWKARDRELERTVAVKIPRRGQLSDEEIEQFFREARAAAQLRHANIVTVHEVGREGDTLFIVSDYIRGVVLSDWMTVNRPSPWEAVRLCLPIVEALEHAHHQGVVHRDLKPSNILLDEAGQPHLTDFGLAKRDVGEITMTVDGQILGTPSYMSPEQAAGQGRWIDRRTDIYSLGVVLFQLLAGELPFRGNAQMQVHQRLTEDAPDPRKFNRHIPRDLSTICLKCLEREPGRRYSTARELADELRRFLRGEPIHARPLSAPARLARWAKRKPLAATTAGLVLFLAIAGPLAALLIERQRSRLEELVSEKNNLIDRYANEKKSDGGRITELQRELDLWEGRANPWEYWPPKRGEAPRQRLLGGVLAHAHPRLTDQLRGAPADSEAAARGYLGLAMLADAAGQTADAVTNYEQARERLAVLQRQHPQQAAFARALAECDTALARLTVKSDRDAASRQLESAQSIYRQLAADRQNDPAAQIEWLEAELSAATLSGYEAGKQHLERVARIHQGLPANWPSDPDEVYRLACFLTESEPVLAADVDASEP